MGDAHPQRTRTFGEAERFPPTVVDHEEFANGMELELLDPGTEEEPRYIWIPDASDEETVFQL